MDALAGSAFERAYDSLTPARQAEFMRGVLAEMSTALVHGRALQRCCVELAANNTGSERADDRVVLAMATLRLRAAMQGTRALARRLHRLYHAALHAVHGCAPQPRRLAGPLWVPRRHWWCRARSARAPPADEDDEPPVSFPPGPLEVAA
jgi:hypothetical protein